MRLRTVYPNALGVLRRNPGVMEGLTAVVVGAIAVLGVLTRLPTIGHEHWTPAADGDARQVLIALGLWPAEAVAVALAWLVASVFLAGIGSVVVHRSLTTSRTPLAQAWKIARPRMPSAIALGVVDVVIILIPLIMAAMLSIAVATYTGPRWPAGFRSRSSRWRRS